MEAVKLTAEQIAERAHNAMNNADGDALHVYNTAMSLVAKYTLNGNINVAVNYFHIANYIEENFM